MLVSFGKANFMHYSDIKDGEWFMCKYGIFVKEKEEDRCSICIYSMSEDVKTLKPYAFSDNAKVIKINNLKIF